MTVEEARANQVCRVCGLSVGEVLTRGQENFQSVQWIPFEPILYNFGKEHAHSRCVKQETREPLGYGGYL